MQVVVWHCVLVLGSWWNTELHVSMFDVSLTEIESWNAADYLSSNSAVGSVSAHNQIGSGGNDLLGQCTAMRAESQNLLKRSLSVYHLLFKLHFVVGVMDFRQLMIEM